MDAFSGCHPLLNFVYFGFAMGVTMFVNHPLYLGLSFLGAMAYAVRLNGWKKTLRTNVLFMLPGLLLVALINPAFNHYGVTPLYMMESGNWITLEAIVYGLVLGCVLFLMILWFSCYNQVMTSDKFLYLFGRLVPALSLIFSMVLRFVPCFSEQLNVIRNGQKAVGRDFTGAGLLKKIRYGLTMLSILITWALEHAINTADSMRSRGFGLHGRTAFSLYRWDRRDKLTGALMAFLMAVFFSGCAAGDAYALYNPRIEFAPWRFRGILTAFSYAVFCFLPVVLGAWEDAAWRRSLALAGQEPETTYREIYRELSE